MRYLYRFLCSPSCLEAEFFILIFISFLLLIRFQDYGKIHCYLWTPHLLPITDSATSFSVLETTPLLWHCPHVLDLEIFDNSSQYLPLICGFFSFAISCDWGLSLHLVTWNSDIFYKRVGNDQNWCQLYSNSSHLAMMITIYVRCICNHFLYGFVHQKNITSSYVSACAWVKCYQCWGCWWYRMWWVIDHCYCCILLHHEVHLLTQILLNCHSPLQ